MSSACARGLVLELAGVEVRLRAGVRGCAVVVRALAAIDLRVRAGERVVVTGGRASGKTVLLLAAAGLVAPARGRVRRAGTVLVADAAGVRRVRAGEPADAPGAAGTLLVADDVRTADELRHLCALAGRHGAALLAAWAAEAPCVAWHAASALARVLRLDAGRLHAGHDERRAWGRVTPAARRVASVAEPS